MARAAVAPEYLWSAGTRAVVVGTAVAAVAAAAAVAMSAGDADANGVPDFVDVLWDQIGLAQHMAREMLKLPFDLNKMI